MKKYELETLLDRLDDYLYATIRNVGSSRVEDVVDASNKRKLLSNYLEELLQVEDDNE